MAMLGPVSLLTLLAAWLTLIVAGYTLMYWAVTDRSLVRSIELSGSSVFTLGTTSDPHLGPLLLTYTEAALGLLLVALLITYLPSIYGAFVRRESGVSLLQVRAGNPPRATNMLIRYHRIEEPRYRLAELWRTLGGLVRGHRGVAHHVPDPGVLPLAAARALLDHVGGGPPRRGQLLGGGHRAPRRIRTSSCASGPGTWPCGASPTSSGSPYDADPGPGRSHQRVPAGVGRGHGRRWRPPASRCSPTARRRGTAWRGWRVNYDAVLLNLARLVEAPAGPVGVGPQPDQRVPSASGDPPRRRKTRRVRAIATTMASRPRAMP